MHGQAHHPALLNAPFNPVKTPLKRRAKPCVRPGQTMCHPTGGQAYARPGSLLRTLRASITGPGLDARLAFGKGVTVDNTGIRREADWLSDAAVHLGTTGSCLLIPRVDTSGSFWTQTAALYGRLTNPIEIEHTGGDYFRSQFGMIEER